MKKALKVLIALILIMCITSNFTFANIYNSGEEAKIENDFYNTMYMIRQGQTGNLDNVKYDYSHMLTYASNLDMGNQTWVKETLNILKKAAEVVGGDILDNLPLGGLLGPISKGIGNAKDWAFGTTDKEFINSFFNSINYNVVKIMKINDKSYEIIINVECPDDEYYKDLNSYIVENYLKSNLISVLTTHIPSYNSFTLGIKKVYVDNHNKLDYNNYRRKRFDIRIKAINENGVYKFDCNDLFTSNEVAKVDKNLLIDLFCLNSILHYEKTGKEIY